MKRKLILFSCLSLLLTACGSEETKEKVNSETMEESNPEVTIDYNIPSPSEQFSLISKLDGTKNTKILHDPALAKNYTNSAQKALNFGVYTADVAYLTSFKETNKYLVYFGELEKLGNDIGVAQVFGNELGELAKKWNGNADSLFMLSDQVYTKTFQRLIEIDKGNELSMMLVGGWIESMYLMVGSINEYGKSPKLEQTLADQKLVAENLMEFLVSYKDNKDVNEYLTEIDALLTIYQDLDCSSSESKVDNKNGKLTFSGGESCKMNEKCFNNLKKKVEEIRAKLISI